MTYNIIICDDDLELAQNLANRVNYAYETLVDDNPNFKDISIEISLVASRFDEVINFITKHNLKNSIYFLDIELGDSHKSGVDLAELVRKHDTKSQIIFITAYDKYAPLTYKRRIGAIDYINKSLDSVDFMVRLAETLQTAVENIDMLNQISSNYFTYKFGHNIQRINSNDIYYIESSSVQHKVHLVTSNGESEFQSNISKLDQKYDFLLKVSQSCVINPKNIVSVNFEDKYLVFPNEDRVYFSRDKKKTIKSLFDQEN